MKRAYDEDRFDAIGRERVIDGQRAGPARPGPGPG